SGDTMESKAHWEHIYKSKATDAVSWYQQHANRLLRLIEKTGVTMAASLVDVGGGASTLVDDLLARNFKDITVVDISASALDAARKRLGARAETVQWLEQDITQAEL